MLDSDGKLRRPLPAEPGNEFLSNMGGGEPRRVINDIDGIGSRANARCEAINQRMEEAKKTLLKTARRKNDDRQAHEFESFVREWCRDPAPPVELMDAYAIGCYGVGAMYLVAYAKELSTFAPQFVDDYELYQSVGEALQRIGSQKLVASGWRFRELGPKAGFALYELAELFEAPSRARPWLEEAERYQEYRKSRTTTKRAARKV